MLFATAALHVLTLAVDAVLGIAIIGGGILLFRRLGKGDD
jgi:hypothetical protein